MYVNININLGQGRPHWPLMRKLGANKRIENNATGKVTRWKKYTPEF